MKTSSSLTLVVMMLLSQEAVAGALYGTVRSNQSYASNITIVLKCPGIDPVRVNTDNRGSYSVYVPVSGRCLLQILRNTTPGPSFEVFVSNKPVRFDFEI